MEEKYGLDGGEGKNEGLDKGLGKVDGWGGDVKKEVGKRVKGVKGE